MRPAYSIDEVTRLYEAALARRGPEAIIGEEISDLGVLARAAAVEMERTRADAKPTDRHSILHRLGSDTFAESYEAVDSLFSIMDMTPPSPQAFANEGVDWEMLAAAYERLRLRDADPELLISPVLPFVSHLADAVNRSWQDLYALLTESPTPKENPLRARPDGFGLQFGTAIHAGDVVQILFAQENERAQAAESHSVRSEDGTIWTVSIVTQSDAASQGNHPYSAFEGSHLRPSEYLTLQALRIRADKTPMDEFSWTWLEGVFDTGSGPGALAGVWVPGYGQVRLYANPVGYAQERLRVRTPVRG